MDFEPKVLRLAEHLGVPPMAAQGMRHQLWAFVVDGGVGEDVTKVSASKWAAALGCKRRAVPRMLAAFIAADYLHREGKRVLVSDWEAVKGDERMAACRSWMRSNPGGVARLAERLQELDDGGSEESETEEVAEVRYLAERREPGEGWPQQSRFLAIIERVNDESDRMVKLIRALRMCVGPRMPLTEDNWETILIAADAVLRMEEMPPR